MRRVAIISLAAAVAVAGCAARMDVGAHLEPSVSFAAYQNWAWAPADALPPSDPRLENSPFFRDYFEGAVERQMALRGLEKTDWGTPDLLLHYHVNVRQRFHLAGADSDASECRGTECNERVTEYEAGTFVLDAVDPYTNRLVWRGWARTSVDGAIDDQDWLRDQVADAVGRMLRLFPRGVSGD